MRQSRFEFDVVIEKRSIFEMCRPDSHALAYLSFRKKVIK